MILGSFCPTIYPGSPVYNNDTVCLFIANLFPSNPTSLRLHKKEKFPLTLLLEEPYSSKYKTIEQQFNITQVSYLKLKN